MQLVDRHVRRIALLLSIGGVLLLALAVASALLAMRSEGTFGKLVRDRDVRVAANALLGAMRDVEIGYRGFLATREPSFLEPYRATVGDIPELLDALDRTAAAADPVAAAGLDRVDALVAERLALVEAALAARGTGSDPAEAFLAGERRGKAVMDELRSVLQGFLDRTAVDFAGSLGALGRLNRWNVAATILGALATVAVVALAFALLARQMRALRGAEGELRELNAGLEERVAERTEDLIRANAEVQRFAYIVTHDLRAPLVNVMGFTSELEASLGPIQAYVLHEGGPLPEDVIREARAAASEDLPEALGFIRASTRKMDGLINAILKISRDGRRELRAERVDLRELADQALGSVAHQIAEGGGEAAVEAEVAAVVSDRLSLEQALGNLVDNAVKYADPARPLRLAVRTRAQGRDRVRIEVEDNGRGIAEADLERVFDLFRRAGRQDRAGEGIGLAHVRTLVRNLGGDVTLRSREGEGSTFTIDLPADLRRVRGTRTAGRQAGTMGEQAG